MKLEFSEEVNRISWEELTNVFERAPLGMREPDLLATAFKNSAVRCFLFDDGRLIGAGRALSDNVSYAAIYDVVLLPEYQGQGLGRQIVKFILNRIQAHTIILFAVPGKEGFYEKLGFRRMKTAMAIFANPEARQERGYIE